MKEKIGKMMLALRKILRPGKGYLSWRRVVKIAAKNLIKGRSRMVVTIGGVGVGVGAIVLLVSFGYGLQELVTERIIWPEALRLTEVTSETSAVKLNKEIIAKIKEMGAVVKVVPAVRTAGVINYSGSKIDVVAVASNADYLKFNNIKVTSGKLNAKAFDDEFDLAVEDQGEVAGVNSETYVEEEKVPEIKDGDKIAEKIIDFRIKDDVYAPVYEKPRLGKTVVGYVLGSILKSYSSSEYWGGTYESLGVEGRVASSDGQYRGKWLWGKFEVFQKTAEGVMVSNGEGREGYINYVDVEVLTSGEVAVEKLLNGEGLVLGIVSDEASAGAEAAIAKSGTDSARLMQMLSGESKSEEEVKTNDLVKVTHDGVKELLVSSSLVKAWGRKDDEVVGQELEMAYLVSGGLFLNGEGKVVSEAVKYRIAGVFEEKLKPMVYVPLADVESLGVVNYSLLKVLVKNEADLEKSRLLLQTMGLVTRSVVDTLSQINRLFTVIRFLLGSFGAIALVVALLGMFNTMTVSLLERTREIGVMKSLGTTNFDVVRIFMSEAAIISLVGAILGVFSGEALGFLVDKTIFRFSGQGMFVLPLPFVLGLLMVVMLVGVATGFYPSRRAAKISALNALRYE